MSTNSTFFKANSDGTFSVRYHHWDGYPEGLGLFLATVVDAPEKVEWLFNLNCGFSTIMRSKPKELDRQYLHKEYEQDTSVDWPPMFTDPQTTQTYLATHPDAFSNTQQWVDLESQWEQQYNYMWDDGWKIVLEYGASVDNCIRVDVPTYIQSYKMLSDLELEDSPVELSWDYFAKKMKCSKKNAQKIVQDWQDLPLNVRTNLYTEFCSNGYKEKDNFVDELDSWITNQKIVKSLSPRQSVVKKKKL